MAFVPPYVSSTRAAHGKSATHGRSWRSSSFIPCERTCISKRCRSSCSELSMSTEQKKKDKEFQGDEERRLQNDKKYVFREFARISAAAVGIGIVLLFYDMLISLVAVGIGSIYAIAVLLEVRGADTLLSRAMLGVSSGWRAFGRAVRDGYRAIRREVRKGLED